MPDQANQAFEVVAGVAPPPPPEAEIAALNVPDEVKGMMRSLSSGGPIPGTRKLFVITSDEWHTHTSVEARNAMQDLAAAAANAYANELRRLGHNWVRIDWIKF